MTKQDRIDAYKHLKKQHPDLKLPPIELPNLKVMRTAVAKQFDAFSDAGLCFEDEYWEREPNQFTDAPEREAPKPKPPKKKVVSKGQSPAVWSEYEGIDHRFYGIGHQCSALTAMREEQGKLALPKDEQGFHLYPTDPNRYKVTKLDNGLQEQLHCFGQRIFRPAKSVSTNSKCAKKEAALDQQLDLAFGPRELYPNELVTLPLSLDPKDEDEGCEWMPRVDGPMEELLKRADERARVSDARYRLGVIREQLGPKKFELLLQSLDKTSQQIADEINARGGDTNANAIRKTVSRARKALASLKCHI